MPATLGRVGSGHNTTAKEFQLIGQHVGGSGYCCIGRKAWVRLGTARGVIECEVDGNEQVSDAQRCARKG